MLRELQNQFEAAVKWVHRVLRQPRHELDRWGRAVRFGYDLFRVGAHQLRHDRAPEMAAALAFRTLFALVPVLVVVTILVRAFLTENSQFLDLIDNLLTSAGLADVRIIATSGADAVAPSVSLKEWIRDLLQDAMTLKVAAAGWLGFALIIYSAISLLMTIEETFNAIFRSPEGRPWTRSVPMYWFLLTVSPLLIGLTAWLNNRVDDWAASLQLAPWLSISLSTLWSVGIMWLLTFIIFTLVPNTAIVARHAAAGALVSVILLEVGKRSLGAFLQKSFAIGQLYGSLGLIPLFMFWVYLMWLAVLFGLEVTSILQQLGGRKLEEMEQAATLIGIVDPSVVVTVMQQVGEDFRAGHATAPQRIAERVRLPERQVAHIIQRLCEAGFLHRVERDEAVCLAHAPELVRADDLMAIGFDLVDAGAADQASPLVGRLREAQRVLASEFTLARLIAPA